MFYNTQLTVLIFTEGGKPENPEKTLVEGERTTHQTNSTHMCPEQESKGM
jgi:hypothetical protein